MTVSGFIIAGLFFCISGSKPLPTLSKERPPTKLFSFKILITIFVQFIFHFLTMYFVRQMALEYVVIGSEDLQPDSDFKPNVLNTVIFLLDIAMQLIVFLVNYQGHPFMQSIKENKPLYYAFIVSITVYLTLALEIIPPINRLMELVPFPNFIFKLKFNGIILLDFICCFICDRFLRRINKTVSNKKMEW